MNYTFTFFLLKLFLVLSYGEITAQTVVILKLQDPCATVKVEENLTQEPSFSLEVYPNPAKDRIMIKASSPEKIGEIKIQLLSIHGAVVFSEKIFSGSNACVKSVNVSDLPRGIYIISVFRGDEKLSKKAIIN